MADMTYKEAQEKGIDTSMVKVCKKLRNLAKLDRIVLDTTQHRSGLNKHLFDYIVYCGYDVLEFVKQYLSNLQPYMIERRKDQEPEQSFICVVDNLYRVSVYIKVDAKQFEEIVVSFHEDNIRGVAKTNSLIKIDTQRYVPVFADSVSSHMEMDGRERYGIKVFIQRGLMVFPLDLVGIKCQDVFIIEKNMINQQLVSYCNDYIRDLYTSNLDLNFEKIEVFSMLQQISFTSYGKDTFSSISLLIDGSCIQTDYIGKSVADSALVTFSQNLRLTEEQQEELKTLLDEKYKVTSIRGIDLILGRVKDNLALLYNEGKNHEEL